MYLSSFAPAPARSASRKHGVKPRSQKQPRIDTLSIAWLKLHDDDGDNDGDDDHSKNQVDDELSVCCRANVNRKPGYKHT